MKVIHLISGGDSGGAKTHVHSLLQNLARTIDVTMVCFMDGPFAQEARELGIPTVIFPGKNLLSTYRELRRFIVDGKYEIIHCHGARGNMMGALLRRSTGLPVVSTVHSDYRLDYLGRPLARLFYGTTNTVALRLLDYRIGVSDAMVDLLISRGFDPDRLFAIYNGLDFSPRHPAMTRAEYLNSLGLTWGEDCVIAGIAARLNPVKDIATLIRGFAKAHQTAPQLRLLIAGDGEERERLGQLAKELGVEDEVCFAGWVTDTDSFYNALDINTLTSLSETFPYALTEGARAGLPTVASRVGGVPYLIEDGVTGFLFEAGDAETLGRHLANLAGDATLRSHLGGRLYQKARDDFSLESTLQRQLQIYETILRRQARQKGKRDGVLVCGAYGRGNAGDDAILEAIVAELRALDPDLPVWVLSRKPDSTRMTYRVNSIYTFAFPRFLNRMRKTRLYINGGGSLMQDVTSHRSLWFYLFTISAAKILGNQVLMYGCGIGPIHSESNRARAARVLQKRVDAITLRDTHSREELESMGVTNPKIVLSADPTVILPAAPEPVVDGLLEYEGLDPKGRYIGFTLRPWPGFREKAEVFAAAADYAYEKHGLTPVFLPIESRLDLGAIRQVTEKMHGPYHVIEDTGSSAHTIGLFSRMKVAVSMRLHALVFAASQGVPLVGVVYDQKISSFLSYIGQDLYTDLSELTLEGLKAHIDTACERIDDRAFLTEGVDRLRQVEHRNSETAAALLGCPAPQV
ncbi:polysaccharide pyruvyl transferase CsaB [Flavonifractor sp. An92]|uniref:polysaccharide pyruvyl transferase CsaB n=1 Tax=Flavonifractor sp. An92 TaxID=1965666 RepID=UPI000B3A49AF|nr:MULTISPECIES: polysaccharide pyruvyl transferase CsaB [unclassified Flavonifractor]OUN03000.1 polysaccharide pyruvyl transferase CsaB [Flavonifractor sp. An92]OUQ18742.1 polysaccharide pyruvyl transferase CsaB [Flavonifractor sp. An135]